MGHCYTKTVDIDQEKKICWKIVRDSDFRSRAFRVYVLSSTDNMFELDLKRAKIKEVFLSVSCFGFLILTLIFCVVKILRGKGEFFIYYVFTRLRGDSANQKDLLMRGNSKDWEVWPKFFKTKIEHLIYFLYIFSHVSTYGNELSLFFILANNVPRHRLE